MHTWRWWNTYYKTFCWDPHKLIRATTGSTATLGPLSGCKCHSFAILETLTHQGLKQTALVRPESWNKDCFFLEIKIYTESERQGWGEEHGLEFPKTLIGTKDDLGTPWWTVNLKWSCKYHTIHLVTALCFSLNRHQQTYMNAPVVMQK